MLCNDISREGMYFAVERRLVPVQEAGPGAGGCATPASGSGAAEALREPAPGTAGAGAGDWVPLVSSPGHSLPL